LTYYQTLGKAIACARAAGDFFDILIFKRDMRVYKISQIKNAHISWLRIKVSNKIQHLSTDNAP